MVRMYEENEVHVCDSCGLTLRVTFAAVPVEPVMCCDQVMKLLGVDILDNDLDLSKAPTLENSLETVYLPGEVYTCILCGIELTILRQAQPVHPLDCCGEGMDKM